MLYTLKQNAKSLKTALETARLLDKTVRMKPASSDAASVLNDDPSLFIAVPITRDGLVAFGSDPVWKEFVKATGQEDFQPSTAAFARHKQR